ncbi:phosphatase PAP2 family protein [Gilliamella sp. B2776]|uniref:phosphatase PAP2 family protein n=1 Tax=unclassified Gilliamella TaxID=2685620 RepID=UPI00226AB66E|nr:MULTISPECIES: phosphatase PAP2 family protein [unclassified Gilliamella]MCX8649189.1 phosphatase PAP2 family protein [Gilliamella sp. B2779]MCX8652935.1 phosphatase PAP2 family protein [Gilliamella sp. B2737]MCX8664680.1 phosphatase PAP2 family protein [Gilliamella sp. B2887]MCX8691001.1 phosphatase PAP2 family protein [Gilliamella sp. B2776]MCX8697275.1 phosphatase PAP2 family protein [Gilliamella sp. B3000]
MWHDFNTQIFLLINASDQASKSFVNFAIFCAKYLVYVPIIIMSIDWFIHPNYRQLIIKMVIGLAIALLITFIIRHLFYSPRPFAVDVGTNYLFHDKTSSLPSQHTVFVWTLFFTAFFNKTQRTKTTLSLLALVALLVSWSRIYLGVHWPLDIFVGFIVSIVSSLIIKKCWIHITKLFNR